MPYQYLSIAGLVLDTLGFSFVVLEWHKAFQHSFYRRAKDVADEVGRQMRLRGMLDPEEPDPDFYDIPPRMRFWGVRWAKQAHRRLFLAGVALIVFGFALQSLAAYASLRPRTVWLPVIGYLQ